jgi:hypothetical protein
MVQETLNEREKTHGDYTQVANLTRSLMANMEYSKNWDELYPFQKESLHMMAVKIARILEGDMSEPDHWHDIAGYSILVNNILKRFASEVSDPVLNND